MSIGGHHSPVAGKDEWLTPPEIIQATGPYDLDPFSPFFSRPWDTAKKHFSVVDDGLEQEWEGRVWCNPPYGRETIHALRRCSEHGNATALVFARTETLAWERYVWECAHSVFFFYGRLHFHHVDGTRAPCNSGGPSALICYDKFNSERVVLALRAGLIRGKFVPLKGNKFSEKSV